MDFPADYFEDKARYVFYVPSMIKHAWAAQIEVLKEVTDVCDRHGIRFFADWGTMLGAVRHGGYIPWDDDLDILMLRKDYVKFLSVAREELPEKYQINNINSHDDFDNLLTRINNTRHVCLEDEFLEHYHNFPCSVGLDIFVIDYLPRDKEMQNQLSQTITLLTGLKFQIEDVPEEERDEYIVPIEEALGVTIDRDKPLMRQFSELCELVASMYNEEESDYLTCMTLWSENSSFVYPKHVFDRSIKIPFENYQIPVPVGYDKLLRKKYGNYMHQVRDHQSHNYPYFEKQYDELLSLINKPTYKPSNVFEPRNSFETPEEIAKTNKLVAFLPAKAEWWPGLESIWKTIAESETASAIVVPLPFYERDVLGRIQAGYYDVKRFPKETNPFSYDEVDLSQIHPDVIYIQVPFDAYNDGFTIQKEYYTNILRDCTDQLIYVPYFIMDDIGPDDRRALMHIHCYCDVPGFANSDYIYVQSDVNKEAYINELLEFFGEDTREIWDKKLIATRLPIAEYNTETKYRLALSEEYLSKKHLCFHMGIATIIEHGNKAIEKLQNIIHTFENSRDKVEVLWWMDGDEIEMIREYEPNISSKLENLADSFIRNCHGVIDKTGDRKRLVAILDAYYGDASFIADMFATNKKPVMIMDLES